MSDNILVILPNNKIYQFHIFLYYMPNTRLQVFIYGGGHNVFFRSNILKLAEKLGLAGYVKNVIIHGREAVEALFEGDDRAITQMVEYCKKGPILAKIERVEVKPQIYKGEFIGFRILYK